MRSIQIPLEALIAYRSGMQGTVYDAKSVEYIGDILLRKLKGFDLSKCKIRHYTEEVVEIHNVQMVEITEPEPTKEPECN